MFATRRFLLLLTLLIIPAVSHAADNVHFLSDRKVWVLDAGTTTYAFGVNERSELQHLYWGAHVSRAEDFTTPQSNREWASFDLPVMTTMQEYPAWGSALYMEPSLKATYANGNRDVVLHYVNQKIDGDTLTVTLKDINSDLFAYLHYVVYPDTGVIARWSTVENRTKGKVTIDSAQSAAWTLPRGNDFQLRYLTGRWGGETQVNTEAVDTGTKVIESRRGSTGQSANPWFALGHRSEINEESGNVWFGALGWSGSWRMAIEQTSHRQVRVTGGYNTFDFGYTLASGQSLDTPPFYGGFSTEGYGGASRAFHQFELAHILPERSRSKLRPVLYNSWEATTFNVDEAGQVALAEKASRIGVERFVIDDGWFGQRKNDHAGLGDWYVNKEKFPRGLKPLIDKVHQLGMDFGIWVEPEMVNPDSDLYRQHPDWAMHFEGRPRTEGRNQLLLNLAREDVKNYVFTFLDKLVSENDIAFLKWDYNRNWAEPGWPEAPLDEQRKIWVKFVDNLYDIIDRLRAKHPKLEIESCSGGGGRVDLGIIKRTEQVWPSDNTDAFDRLSIQNGFTYAYTPKIMMAWVTDVPNGINKRTTSLPYRFLVAMEGSLGIGANLNKWSDDDFKLASSMVGFYKDVRSTVQTGRLYRLRRPDEDNFAATEYVAQDGRQAVVYAFLHSQQLGYTMPPLYLRGLDEKATYQLEVVNAKAGSVSTTLSGSYLMHRGLDLTLTGDFSAMAVKLTRQ